MSVLIGLLGPFRALSMAIDSIAFSLLDDAYQIVIELSSATLLQQDTIESLMNNLYILFGVVAFFRLAILLVNSIIDPEKLNKKGKGLSNIFFRVVGMIIILFITPWLFQASYELQGKIVGSEPSDNIIFKMILGNRANIGGSEDGENNAGVALQNIVLSSLITIDDAYLVQDGFEPLECVSNGDGTCTNQGGYIYDDSVCDWDNCKEAVTVYNDMYVNERMSPINLSKYVGVSKKIDGEEVYVYKYMFIVTSIVGIFLTYIIISFAVDIAIRMFELIVLEILSPLFIATFVDPKSTQSGPFKNWLSAVGKSYANLYIKLAILALATLLIMLVNQSDIFSSMGGVSGWAKIFVIIGLLIFAKKAPKWIMDMIGIQNGGMGLWSPKKLRENMAGMGFARAAVGATAAGISNRIANGHRNETLRRKANDEIKRREEAGEDLSKRDKKQIKKDYGATRGQSFFRNAAGAVNALSQGASAAKNTDGGIIASGKAALEASAKFKTSHGLNEEGKLSRALGSAKTGVQRYIWGNRNLLNDIEDENKKQIKAGEWTANGRLGRQDSGLGEGKVIVGQKGANDLCDAIVSNEKTMGKLNSTSFAAGQYALNQGYAKIGADGKIDLSNVEIDAAGKQFKFTNESGKVENVSFEALSKNCNGILDQTSGAPVMQEQMVNTYKTQSLANYQQNEQLRSQAMADYQGAQSQVEKIEKSIQGVLGNIADTFQDNGVNVTLDRSSVKGITTSIDAAMREINDKKNDATSNDERARYDDILHALEKNKEDVTNDYAAKNTFESISEQSLENIKNINVAQNILKPVINAIDGSTITEKDSNLQIENKKIQEAIEKYSKQDDNKNGS